MNKRLTFERHSIRKAKRGFSLVEMAIVLAIVALLLAGLLPTLSAQIEQQRRTETRKLLDEIQQALFGYAIINGHLPCPSSTTNPNFGEADASCVSPTAEGFLPWKTLGVSETDAWGIKGSTQHNGYWRYRVEPSFASSVAFTLATTSNSSLDLQVRDSANTRLTSSSERPLAIIFSTGPDLVPNGENADYEQSSNATYQSDAPGKNSDGTNFDDMTVWISRPLLFSRMVTAGKLP